ncbi:PKD domain-containing protein [Chitinophagaceae bacterium LB-8]|uniref:PKD domain-containing protein n=1 Tax=Paraflavisolibacter caeni TaxID=2982496 RepID=A0A9X2XVX3_9BACT|nr:PKD domain-containing protein [Paraflavisolibacter caeni]MCU7548673.1 PKD domain-containing protein [Paraflavisolibacter caeni]
MKTKTLFLTLLFLSVSTLLWAQRPVANFTSNATNGCAPIIVNFQDRSSGNPTSWKWDFGNGSTSTKQNPSTSYFTAGTYTVTLTVSNASGSNTVTKTSLITVYDGPTVDFIADKTTSCAPGRIQYTDKATPSPGTTNNTWFWDFGDGTSSTAQNPQHVYRSPGQFTVFLKITNDKGCFKMLSKPNFVTITSGLSLAFTNTLPAFCHAPDTIKFTNSSKGPGTLSYNWLFGDGDSAQTQHTSHAYIKDSTYSVSLIVSSSLGCIDTLTKTNAVIIGGMKSDFTVSDTLCGGNSVSFKNTSSPTPNSSRWVFPDGTASTATNAAKTFPVAGPYDVKLINQFGSCKDSVTKTINVSAKPVVDFTSADTVRCSPPSTVNFQNKTNDGISYIWRFGNGDSSRVANPSYTYVDSGTYSVKLIATNAAGCVDSLSKASFIKIKKPVISFKNLPVRGCLPYTLKPVADIKSVDNVLTYEWDFGDGGTSSQQFPTYIYTKQGTYSVTLTITTSTGCRETITLPGAVRVGTKPDAQFTASTANTCASAPVQFTVTSPPPTDEYIWYFGDGGSSRNKNPTYNYVDTGNMIVSLVVYNSGCGDTAIAPAPIYVKPPISKFNYRPNCAQRLEFTFTDVSIGAQSWTWNYGDGSPAVSGQTPAPHTFPTRGNYNVSLTTGNGACSYTYTTTVRIVDQTPSFTASAQEGCKTFKPQFFPSTPVQIRSFTWNFGDGQSVTSFQPTHSYTTAGTYTVKLYTTDTYGCIDSTSRTNFIKVNGPTASFGSLTNRGCKGLTTSFLDSSKADNTNAIVKWQWSFGDGIGKSTVQNPSYKYDTIGAFNVKLIVEDAGGCIDSITRNNFVQVSTLKAAWNAVNESCPKANITFNNTTAGSFTSSWSFGDGSTSTTTSPTYAYKDTGSYTIKLKVRDNIGCEDSLVRPNYLRIGKPVADFTANNLTSFCVPFEAKFTNTSKFYNSFIWTFQKATSLLNNPTTYYTQTVKDTVKLLITSPGGCKDSVSKVLQVKNASDGKVTYNPLVACTPANINFEAFEPINAKFTWDFGDGNIIDTSANKLVHTYTDFGKFLPKVILEEQCIIPLTGLDTIRIYGVDAKFVMNKKLFCDTGTVAFTDSSVFNTRITSYKWNFGDGSISSQQNPVHFYRQTGSYNVRLDVMTEAGCPDSAFFSPLKVVQTPRITTAGDTAICLNDRVGYTGTFTIRDTSVIRWLWQFPNGKSSSLQNPELQLYPTAGDYKIKTLVVNSSGCSDSAFLPLHVYPLPDVIVPAALTTFSGGSITIPASYSQGITNYNWTPAQGLSCSDCPQPVAAPKFSTKYTVTATDEKGCHNTGNVHVSVICPTVNVFVPNTFSPNGDGKNDILYVRGKGIERVKSLRVFNRWGEIVFEKREIPANIESVQYGWDGKNKGAPPHPDVYIYQAEVYCANGDILRFEGNVALIQ